MLFQLDDLEGLGYFRHIDTHGGDLSCIRREAQILWLDRLHIYALLSRLSAEGQVKVFILVYYGFDGAFFTQNG